MKAWRSCVLLLVTMGACQCDSKPQTPEPRVCQNDLDCRLGERCGENNNCESRQGCLGDTDCLVDERCRLSDGRCLMRTGFARECDADNVCYPGFFCALGRCRDSQAALVCARAVDCPVGMRCDRQHFYCIEEVPCTLGEYYAEITCDPEQSCDAASGSCLNSGPAECTPATQAQDCGPDELCDAGGRCVQCLIDADCGPGLVCNARAGRCESADLCRSNADCASALVCDPSVALCRVPLPPCNTDLDCALYELCDHVTGSCTPRAGKCEDDRLEQNDAPDGALLLELTDTQLVLDELMLCPDDGDFFAVDLEAGQALTVRVDTSVNNAQAELSLIAANGIDTLRQGYAPPRGNGVLSYTTSIASRIYLRVLSLTAPVAYVLSVSKSAGVVCVDDVLEGESGNNTPEFASDLATGTFAQLSLCDADVDFFLVSMAGGDTLSVSATATHADLDLALLDRQTLATIASATAIGVVEQLSYRSVIAQTLLLRVSAFQGAPDSYTLTLSKRAPFVCQVDAYDGLAANDAAQDASVIGAEGLDAVSLTLCGDDVDWFQFYLEDYQRLLADVRFASVDADIDIEVYANQGQNLLSASRAGPGLEAVSVAANGVAQSLWLKVYASDRASAAYVLNAHVDNGAQCFVDSDEPNETPAQAKPIVDSSLRWLCGFDEDVYRVDLVAGKLLDVAIFFSPAEGDLDLQLIHPDGVTVLRTSDGVGDSERITYQAEATGTHFLRVYSLGTDAAARYLLDLDIR